MLNCPHCGAPVKAYGLVSASFWRPLVCLTCAQASRVVRPFGQNTVLSIFGLLVRIACVRFLLFPYYLFAFVGAAVLMLALDVLLLERTVQLKLVLPKVPSDAA